jgi:hypothetical protein
MIFTVEAASLNKQRMDSSSHGLRRPYKFESDQGTCKYLNVIKADDVLGKSYETQAVSLLQVFN